MKHNSLSSAIKAAAPFPALGSRYAANDYFPLNLAVGHAGLEGYDTASFVGLEAYVEAERQQQGGQVGYGGYGENRLLYWNSPHFGAEGERRTIHLGIDLWAPAGTPVFASLEGRVHSFAYNDQVLDYGATIVLEHELGSQRFYTLYGHLALSSLTGLSAGQAIAKGQAFANLGPPAENGGWPPHLHLQLILDMQGYTGDFPGVARRSEAARWLEVCPDPIGLTGINNSLPNLQLIIFDLDGTLIDSRYDLADAVNFALDKLNLAPISYERLPQMLGSGLNHLIQTAMGKDDPALLKQARQYFDGFYRLHSTDKTRCYEGVEETLAALPGIKKAVYSNKMQHFTEDIIQKLGLAPYFELVLGAQPERYALKPDPAGIRFILEELAVAPQQALILGDSTHDIEAGQAAGLRTGAVTYGYRPAEALAAAGPDFMIGRFEDLCLYL